LLKLDAAAPSLTVYSGSNPAHYQIKSPMTA
jgi:hypothetical protein